MPGRYVMLMAQKEHVLVSLRCSMNK